MSALPTAASLLPRPEPVAPAPPLVPAFHRIVRTAVQTHDTFTIWVAPPDGEGPLDFAPGQFCMLFVPGIGEAAISISSADADGNLVFTIRAVGGVTNALGTMRPGDVVGVRGPFGTAWPIEDAKGHDLVIVAGGLGLAPLRPTIEIANRDRRDYRSVTVLVGARTPDDLLFRRELLGWGGLPDIDVQIAVDRANGDWPGRVGVVTQFIPGLEVEPADTYALLCGPEIMMRFAARDLIELGVPADRIFVSLERTMRCGVGTCGHCQLGPVLICRDGAVFPYSFAAPLMEVHEL